MLVKLLYLLPAVEVLLVEEAASLVLLLIAIEKVLDEAGQGHLDDALEEVTQKLLASTAVGA